MKAVDLLERNYMVWKGPTRHPFLEAVREGRFPADAFEAWLAQDYLFVGDALAFQARLLARTPRPARAVLPGGLVAIEAELGFIEEQAERLGFTLDTPRHPATATCRSDASRSTSPRTRSSSKPSPGPTPSPSPKAWIARGYTTSRSC